ncbi:MAG: glycosyltransferase family 2 protein [Bacteroidota bacterium]
MTQRLKISVIIPAYNCEDKIVGAIQSAIAQTYPVFEIIVINDGSTDNTLTVIRNIANNWAFLPSLCILDQVNQGQSMARNSGINSSKGDWIAFLDADDVWLPEKIEKQINVLKENPNVVIIGTGILSSNYNVSHVKVSFNAMLFRNVFNTSSVLVKKSEMPAEYFDKGMRYAEDFRVWIQIVRSKEGIVLNEGLIKYATNEKRFKRNSLSTKLWQMEKGELSNFNFLYRRNYINIFTYGIVSVYSLMKFLRRVLLSL